MPNFASFLYDDTGAAVSGATVNLYDRNTVTPSRANTATDANGYWSISHATEGRFDIEITSGTSKRRIKYDDAYQGQEIETSNLLVRNPANTFSYDIVPAAIVANRTLNLPLTTATETLAVESNSGITKFWVYWEQTGAHGIIASDNMTSVTDGGAAGDTDHVIATDFSTANWAALLSTNEANTIGVAASPAQAAGTITTHSFNSSAAGADSDVNFLAGLGAQ